VPLHVRKARKCRAIISHAGAKSAQCCLKTVIGNLSDFERGEIGLDLFRKACEFGLEGPQLFEIHEIGPVKEALMFERIPYDKLNARQKEDYNFHQVAARLAEYGYNSLRLNDDWLGADLSPITQGATQAGPRV
jgi:hypothetical protein